MILLTPSCSHGWQSRSAVRIRAQSSSWARNGRISMMSVSPSASRRATQASRVPPVPIITTLTGSRSRISAAASISRSWRFCGAAKRVATTMSSPGPALGPAQLIGTLPTLTPMSATKAARGAKPMPISAALASTCVREASER